jgi:hypothetical protein
VHQRFEMLFIVFMVLTVLVLIDTIQKISSTTIDDPATEVHGRVVSLQFANDGSATWVISGTWALEIDYDINGIIPESLKSFSVSLTTISVDGLDKERYDLSEFNTSKISYDNESHISTFEGELNMVTPDKKLHIVNGSFTLFEREVVIITLDPSITRNYFGVTPIYGVER